MNLPEPIAGFQWNQGWRHWEQVIPAAMREEGVVPMYTEAQLREALASHEAVMRMALGALLSDEHCNCIPTPLTDKAIKALEDALK